MRNRQSCIRALKGVSPVIHLTGAVGVGQSLRQARKYMDLNAGGTTTFDEILTRDQKIREQIEKIVVA